LRVGEEIGLVSGGSRRVDQVAALRGVRVVADGASLGQGEDGVERVLLGRTQVFALDREQQDGRDHQDGGGHGRRDQGVIDQAAEPAGQVDLQSEQRG
jgi:hypothetical protein